MSKPTAEEIKALIQKISLTEEVVRTDSRFLGGGHVALIFNDGEMSSQKAGELLWQRNLHCFRSGHPSARLPVEWFPQRIKEFGFVFADHSPDAELLVDMIRNYFT